MNKDIKKNAKIQKFAFIEVFLKSIGGPNHICLGYSEHLVYLGKLGLSTLNHGQEYKEEILNFWISIFWTNWDIVKLKSYLAYALVLKNRAGVIQFISSCVTSEYSLLYIVYMDIKEVNQSIQLKILYQMRSHVSL